MIDSMGEEPTSIGYVRLEMKSMDRRFTDLIDTVNEFEKLYEVFD